jgi:putative endonuclease
MYFVYAIQNLNSNKIYIGQTANLDLRLKRHNHELVNKKTSFTSKNRGQWVLIYKEACENRSLALKREKELKSAKGRQFIKTWVRSSVG